MNVLHVTGVCKHDNIFEGSTDVRHVKFNGNILAIAMTDGRLCLVDMTSGDIVDRFNAHDKGIHDVFSCISIYCTHYYVSIV